MLVRGVCSGDAQIAAKAASCGLADRTFSRAIHVVSHPRTHGGDSTVEELKLAGVKISTNGLPPGAAADIVDGDTLMHVATRRGLKVPIKTGSKPRKTREDEGSSDDGGFARGSTSGRARTSARWIACAREGRSRTRAEVGSSARSPRCSATRM